MSFLSEVSNKILSRRGANLNTTGKVEKEKRNLSMKNIAVLGSINIDMITKVPKIPRENEVVISEGLKLVPGGKATNAAIAMARLGEMVYMTGKIGNDFFGEQARLTFKKEGVNIEYIDTDSFIPTGTVLVNVDNKGKNTLIVNQDANIRINKQTISDFLEKVDRGLIKVDCFYTTLEPLTEIFEFAIKEFKKRKVVIFCDAAPESRPLPEYLYKYIDFLSANEFEVTAMTGIKVTNVETACKAAQYLKERGANNVIITLGKLGAVLLEKGSNEPIHFPGKKVRVIDETAAGDAFRGGFVSEYLKNVGLHRSMEFANLTGAFAVTKLGAYDAMPTREELEFLEVLNDKDK